MKMWVQMQGKLSADAEADDRRGTCQMCIVYVRWSHGEIRARERERVMFTSGQGKVEFALMPNSADIDTGGI